MKNKDIIEWMLDEGIDPLTTVTTDNGEMYLSDILTKHLMEQLRIHDVSGQLPNNMIIYRQARKLDYAEFCKWLNAKLVNLR